MTPDRQALERAARAYLAAYDVESSNSEMWYRAVVDARDALRAALAEATEPATKPEGCPCVCCANRAGMLRAGRTDLRGACYCGMVEDEERCDCAFCLSPTKLVSCSETATPPTPAEGRGEEAVVTAAIRDVLAERAKQRRKWGDSHDDDHKHGELTIAAAELAVAGTDARVDNAADGPDPWGLVRKNPNRRDQLVIAAALLLAEIERKDRAIRPLPHGDGGGKGAK